MDLTDSDGGSFPFDDCRMDIPSSDSIHWDTDGTHPQYRHYYRRHRRRLRHRPYSIYVARPPNLRVNDHLWSYGASSDSVVFVVVEDGDVPTVVGMWMMPQ